MWWYVTGSWIIWKKRSNFFEGWKIRRKDNPCALPMPYPFSWHDQNREVYITKSERPYTSEHSGVQILAPGQPRTRYHYCNKYVIIIHSARTVFSNDLKSQIVDLSPLFKTYFSSRFALSNEFILRTRERKKWIQMCVFYSLQKDIVIMLFKQILLTFIRYTFSSFYENFWKLVE